MTEKGKMKKGSGKGSNMCLVVTGLVIAILLLIVILALTVFKPQHPISRVSSIKLQDMDMSFDIFSMRVKLNVTLHVDVSVENTNMFGFKYSDSSAKLNYRGKKVGEAPIPNGKISSGEIKLLKVTLTVMADRLFSNSQFPSDAASGTLPLNTMTRIFGEVNILGFIKVHVDSSSSCDFNLNLSDKTVEDKKCKDSTKLD
ncbi:Late embryogenesis abundant protein [Sesbania bispinosa]|nr:Late embryogenesis abundant protein [Sesbania bispinosa]